jgi:hypothetical protein
MLPSQANPDAKAANEGIQRQYAIALDRYVEDE